MGAGHFLMLKYLSASEHLQRFAILPGGFKPQVYSLVKLFSARKRISGTNFVGFWMCYLGLCHQKVKIISLFMIRGLVI